MATQPAVLVLTEVSIEAVARLRERHPERFLRRAFTSLEQKTCLGRRHPDAGLAARWAARSALAKALRSLERPSRFSPFEAEVLRDERGAPAFVLGGRAAEACAGSVAKLSLAHDGGWAVAAVLLVSQPEPTPSAATSRQAGLPKGSSRARRLRLVMALAAVFSALAGWVFYELSTLPDPSVYATRVPETTALIEARAQAARAQGKKPRRRQTWVSPQALPPYVVHAVLVSEDAGFYAHQGLDKTELRRAVGEAVERKQLGRGASTITQQLAKNLWLSEDRSLLRKVKELVLARRLEERLTKQRILALYLNVAEWGDGVYGIDAGAREHFSVGAAELSVAQAAVLAAMLPSPRRWTMAQRPPVLATRARRNVDWLEQFGRIDAAAAQDARAELDRLFSSAGSDDTSAPAGE